MTSRSTDSSLPSATTVGLVARGGGRVGAEALADLDLLMRSSSGNLGNFAFWRGARLMLGGAVRSIAARVPLDADIGALLIPAANWLASGSDFGWLADVVEAADVPTVMVGLGAQAADSGRMPELSAGTLRLLAAVERRSPFIAVRGEFTRQVCAHHGIHKVRVLGCPSLFLNSDRALGETIAARWPQPCRRLASHGFSERARADLAERLLFAMVTARDDAQFIVQAPRALLGALLSPAQLTAADRQALARHAARIAPDRDIGQFLGSVRRHGHLPASIDAWLGHLSGFSHTINTRIHGTLLSLAAGVPAICLSHDSRTQELATTMQAPQLAADALASSPSPEELFAQLHFDAQVFDEQRTQLARGYVELLRAAGMTPSAAALQLAAA